MMPYTTPIYNPEIIGPTVMRVDLSNKMPTKYPCYPDFILPSKKEMGRLRYLRR